MIGMFQAVITIYGTAMGFGPLVQAYRIYRRKSSADVSLFFLNLIGWGCLLWLIWGLLSKNVPLIIANAFACITYGIAITVAVYYSIKR